MPECEYFDWTSVNWNDLYPRLLAYAARKLDRLSWRGQRSGAVPGARQAQDFVQDAIEKTITGKRKWNSQEIALFDFLVGVISSEINHLVVSPDNTRVLGCEQDGIIRIVDHRSDPETNTIRNDHERAFLAFLAAKSSALLSLAQLILHEPGAIETSSLAKRLNLSTEQVKTLKKSLQRAAREFLENEARKAERDAS
jgi:hypothetical protein